MSSLVDLSRLFPHLCPGLFPSAAAPREAAPTRALEQAAPVPAGSGQDAASCMRARQLKKLHQRILRNQRNGGTLTHSGLLTA